MLGVFYTNRASKGFTIVELLVVIVVLAILASITYVSFNGIQSRATETAIKSDLRNGASRLELAVVSDSVYPPSKEAAGLKSSGGVTLQYSYYPGDNSYCLTGTTGKANVPPYYISSQGRVIVQGLCPGHGSDGQPTIPPGYEVAPVGPGGSEDIGGYVAIQPSSCPSNGGSWVKVPGNTLYNQPNGFCVQQYPASNVGGVATSQASSNRWTGLTRDVSANNAAALGSGAHLFSEREWMTVAANAAMQPANWSGGSVGSGTLPIGSTSGSKGVLFVVLSNGERLYFDTGAVTNNAYVEYTCYEGTNASSCGLESRYQPQAAGQYHTDQLPGSVSSFGDLSTTGGFYYGDPRYANPGLSPYITSARNNGLGYLRSNYSSGSTTRYSTTRGYFNGATTSGLFGVQFNTLDSYAHATYGFRAAK